MNSKRSNTYYDALGVPRDASQEAIHLAYREMAKKLHPDTGGSIASMDALTHAYNVLSNPEQRKAYDASLYYEEAEVRAQQQEMARSHAELSPEDILHQEQALVDGVKRSAVKYFAIGIGLIILGVVVTVATYSAASEGGKYILAWGPMLFGAVFLVKGIFNYVSPHTSLKRSLKSKGNEPVFKLEKPGQAVKAGVISGAVVAAMLIIVAIGMNLSGASSPAAPSSQAVNYKARYDACLVEFKTIEQNLNDINARLDSYEAAGDTASYNSLIDEQNELAGDYKTTNDKCQTYRRLYNAAIK